MSKFVQREEREAGVWPLGAWASTVAQWMKPPPAILASFLLQIQLPANGLVKVTNDGPSVRAPTPTGENTCSWLPALA